MSLIVKKPVTVMVIDHVETGKKARALRESIGAVGRLIARRMGVSQGLISNLESGQAKWTESYANRYVSAVDAARRMMRPRKVSLK